MTVHIDCRSVAKGYRDWIRACLARRETPPCLATVMLRERADAGSLQYRDLMIKDAESLGFHSQSIEAGSQRELVASLGDLNNDPDVQGIVVLYPLGLSRSDEEIMDLVSPQKDIEGLHSINLGYLIKYKRFLDASNEIKCVVPATPKAVVKTLQYYKDIRIEGAFVTIVNNSMRVGKPLGLMLENLGATVVKCYDKTPRKDLEACVRRSDIVVTAVPDPAFRLPPKWFRAGSAVVDVSFQGNVDVGSLEGRSAYVTQAENRIGKMTRAMTFVNLIYCARQQGVVQRV